jgi:hypothetical protein
LLSQSSFIGVESIASGSSGATGCSLRFLRLFTAYRFTRSAVRLKEPRHISLFDHGFYGFARKVSLDTKDGFGTVRRSRQRRLSVGNIIEVDTREYRRERKLEEWVVIRCLRVFLVSLRLYHTQGEAPEAASQFSYTYGWERSSVRLEHSYELFAAANSAGKTQATAPFAIEVLHVLY